MGAPSQTGQTHTPPIGALLRLHNPHRSNAMVRNLRGIRGAWDLASKTAAITKPAVTGITYRASTKNPALRSSPSVRLRPSATNPTVPPATPIRSPRVNIAPNPPTGTPVREPLEVNRLPVMAAPRDGGGRTGPGNTSEVSAWLASPLATFYRITSSPYREEPIVRILRPACRGRSSPRRRAALGGSRYRCRRRGRANHPSSRTGGNCGSAHDR